MDAARQQNWDASVTALVALPDVLSRLNQDVRWTTDLGNAFLAQQSDVMAAVQRMRARAQQNGKLRSTPQQTVTDESQGGQTAIQIVPANPEVIYVPTYDPAYVWGPPAWGAYPYFGYPAYGFGFGPGIDIGLCFGGWAGWGGWGWGPNWFGGGVYINGGFFNRYGFRGGYGYRGGFGGRGVWAHDPGHRLGFAYPNRQLSGRYQSASIASRSSMMQRSAARNSFGQSYGASRNAGGQGYRGSAYQNGGARNSGGASRSYNGGAAGRSYGNAYNGGAARSFNGAAARGSAGGSYSGGAARSYNGGGAARSYNGGGATRSFGGGWRRIPGWRRLP